MNHRVLRWFVACALVRTHAARGKKVDKRAIKLDHNSDIARSKTRAWLSANKQTFHPIPDNWGGGIMCDDPLRENEDFVIALATDEVDPIPVFAVINSTVANARTLKRISFAVLVGRGSADNILALTRAHIPKVTPTGIPVHISVCVGLNEQLMRRPAMRSLANLANSTRIKRKELLSSFNFAAFYLPHILSASRVLYLDSDVIVRGDLGELASLKMGDKPAAAVEDCTQRLHRYVDFSLAETYNEATARRIRAQIGACAVSQDEPEEGEEDTEERPRECEPMPHRLPPENTCVFNRGVLLLNRDVWLKERLAERIERLVVDFVHSRGVLFRSGVSQPPFLVALADRYLRLDGEWNVRGLGRDAIGRPEWTVIAKQTAKYYGSFPDVLTELQFHMRQVAKKRHADRTEAAASLITSLKSKSSHIVVHAAVAKSVSQYDTHFPYVCPFAAHAKIIHFNGEVKPWRMTPENVMAHIPLDGAMCLWRDVRTNVTEPSSLPDFCTNSKVSNCLTSCSRDWVRYVEPHLLAEHASAFAHPPELIRTTTTTTLTFGE